MCPRLHSSLILPPYVRPHLPALLGIILVNEAQRWGEVFSLPNQPQHKVCQRRETFPALACHVQGPAFSFEDILDMGTSSLGTWDLAKSQTDPCAFLLVQLEL